MSKNINSISQLKEGQKIYLQPHGNAERRYKGQIQEAVIAKIGRKYFETESHGRFYKDSLKQDNGEYMSEYTAYLSKTALEEKLEKQKISQRLNHYFSVPRYNLQLSQLKAIAEIIGMDIHQ